MQQGDVKLFQTNDDGDISVEGGIVEMSGGLETAVYLSLFGGNEDGSAYWADHDETEAARKYVSETQTLLRSIPATSGNLLRVEDAVVRDLAWLITEKVASSVAVSVTIPALNRIHIQIDVEAVGEESSFTFVENWKATT